MTDFTTFNAADYLDNKEVLEEYLKLKDERIADLLKEADMMHSEYKTARARIAELEAEIKHLEENFTEWLKEYRKQGERITALEAALLPFAAIADESTANLADNYMYSDCYPMSAFRAAKAALENK